MFGKLASEVFFVLLRLFNKSTRHIRMRVNFDSRTKCCSTNKKNQKRTKYEIHIVDRTCHFKKFQYLYTFRKVKHDQKRRSPALS